LEASTPTCPRASSATGGARWWPKGSRNSHARTVQAPHGGSCSSARALAQQATAAPESRAAAGIEGEQEANHGEVHRKERNKGEKVKR